MLHDAKPTEKLTEILKMLRSTRRGSAARSAKRMSDNPHGCRTEELCAQVRVTRFLSAGKPIRGLRDRDEHPVQPAAEDIKHDPPTGGFFWGFMPEDSQRIAEAVPHCI
jgi:hypothetical protein